MDELEEFLAEELEDPEFAAAYARAEARSGHIVEILTGDQDPVWTAWAEGTGRCPLCVGCKAVEWYSICDCWMAPDPVWRRRFANWGRRLRHPIEWWRMRTFDPDVESGLDHMGGR